MAEPERSVHDRTRIAKIAVLSLLLALLVLGAFITWAFTIKLKVDHYVDHWFSQNILYAGERSSAFRGFATSFGSLQMTFTTTVHLKSGKTYTDVYAYTVYPAGSATYGDIALVH